ncbi:hypothetical protein GCM10009735_14850 [Actinomadura chokoriensis]
MDITLEEIAVESYDPADAESAAYFERPHAPGQRGRATRVSSQTGSADS